MSFISNQLNTYFNILSYKYCFFFQGIFFRNLYEQFSQSVLCPKIVILASNIRAMSAIGEVGACAYRGGGGGGGGGGGRGAVRTPLDFLRNTSHLLV